mmetsp:Transcript_40660/g.100481  ORF Transcript_40660/g.100481 Transcript_40660/m.100481 type:complete len:326 (-) Transcript_40660:73-1050(-)
MYTGTVKLSSFIAFLSKARHPPARQRARQLSRGLGLGLSLCLGFCLGLGRLGLLLGLGLGLGGVRFGTFFGRVADAVRRLFCRDVRHEVGDGALAQLPARAHPHVDRARHHFRLPHHQDVVVLLFLRLENHFGKFVQRSVHVDMEASGVVDLSQFLGVFELRLRDGHHHALTGREPQRPLAGVVFGEDCDHSFHRPQHSAVDHHRTQPSLLGHVAFGGGGGGSQPVLRLRALALVGEVEAVGQVEVELHSGALKRALQRIVHAHVNLGAVEGAVSFVELPRLSECVERLLQRRLSTVPQRIVADFGLRPSGEAEAESHAEDGVHV